MSGGAVINAWFDGVCEPKNPGGHGGWGCVVLEDDLLNRLPFVHPLRPHLLVTILTTQSATERTPLHRAIHGVIRRAKLVQETNATKES